MDRTEIAIPVVMQAHSFPTYLSPLALRRGQYSVVSRQVGLGRDP